MKIPVFTICLEDLPDGFEAIGSDFNSDEHCSSLNADNILLFFANLNYSRPLIDYIKNLFSDTFAGLESFDNLEIIEEKMSQFEVIAKKLFSDIEYDIIQIAIRDFLGCYADEDERRQIKKDSFPDYIEKICSLADMYVDALHDPDGTTLSGRSKKDAIVSVISATNYVGIAFDLPFRPVLGYCGDKFTYVKAILATDVISILNLSVLGMLKEGTSIKKCKNCGSYFMPSSRSDELYCRRRLPNGMTCQSLGYDSKIKDNKILSAYRKIYKTQNARKQRNRHRVGIDNRFDCWSKHAKKLLENCQNGQITLDEMVTAMSSSDWLDGK